MTIIGTFVLVLSFAGLIFSGENDQLKIISILFFCPSILTVVSGAYRWKKYGAIQDNPDKE
jgi:hypothetical protein